LSALLLDTHALLWWRAAPERLGSSSRVAIEEEADVVYFSPASVWEIAIKRAKGRLDAPPRLVETMVERGFRELPIRSAHALKAGGLPQHHSDPFDRMLVAQAQSENLTLVSDDGRIAAYDVPVFW
jgi:PIN domain nuclease of toxin-antitoxin system